MSDLSAMKWFRRYGPVCWYHDEWLRLDLELFGRAFAVVWLRAMGQLVLVAGSTVVSRSAFGCPAAFKGGLRLRF